jgi:hypothetical protein
MFLLNLPTSIFLAITRTVLSFIFAANAAVSASAGLIALALSLHLLGWSLCDFDGILRATLALIILFDISSRFRRKFYSLNRHCRRRRPKNKRRIFKSASLRLRLFAACVLVVTKVMSDLPGTSRSGNLSPEDEADTLLFQAGTANPESTPTRTMVLNENETPNLDRYDVQARQRRGTTPLGSDGFGRPRQPTDCRGSEKTIWTTDCRAELNNQLATIVAIIHLGRQERALAERAGARLAARHARHFRRVAELKKCRRMSKMMTNTLR